MILQLVIIVLLVYCVWRINALDSRVRMVGVCFQEINANLGALEEKLEDVQADVERLTTAADADDELLDEDFQ